MKNKLVNVLFDCERMKYPQTGLFYFCLHLGMAIEPLLKKNNLNPIYYIPKSANSYFEDQPIIFQNSLHKFILPNTRDIDIWHTTYQGSLYFPFKKKVPIVLTIHDLNFMYDEEKTIRKKERYLEDLKRKVERADVITAISKFTLSEVEKHIPLNGKQYNIIHNGCNISEIINFIAPVYTPKNPFLFTIGTITDKKNFHTLVPLLVGNTFLLLIAGVTQSEAYKKTIINEAIKFGVIDRIVFLGPISENDKQYYLKYCEAFLFPSLAEGFGLPVIEAMYFGKLVILSNKTSLPEIGGKHAYYFDTFEPDSMRMILRKSIEHYNLTNPFSLIKSHAESFSWEKAAENYTSVYLNLLNG